MGNCSTTKCEAFAARNKLLLDGSSPAECSLPPGESSLTCMRMKSTEKACQCTYVSVRSKNGIKIGLFVAAYSRACWACQGGLQSRTPQLEVPLLCQFVK
jgi:hypothetical protein